MPRRSGEAGGRDSPGGAGEELRAMPGPLGPGSLLSSQACPPTSKAPSRPRRSWGHRREAGEIRRGRWEGPSGTEEQERRGGCLPRPLEPRKPAGLPGEVPRPLRPGVGGTPGNLLFLEPFPALWVLSIGPTHRPNIALA